jgi:Zn-dependent peptidase ImmA (M78 family)
MGISRIDLDGKGMGSPEALVTAILKAEKDLPIPVPIETLCQQLDIDKIAELDTDAFEGGLITDTTRSSGVILINRNRPRQRQRFTMGHELGHFLIPTHIPSAEGRFLCSRDDMAKLNAKEGDRRARMEVEANRFSSLLLIPPPHFRKDLKTLGGADLCHITSLAKRYDVSKEAMSRAYASYHEDLIAIIVCKDGKIIRHYCDRVKFPYLQPTYGSAVPNGSIFHLANHEPGIMSDIRECTPDVWINVERGKPAPTLFEQYYPQRDGYGLLMLKLEVADEDDEEEERDLEGRWRVGFHR